MGMGPMLTALIGREHYYPSTVFSLSSLQTHIPLVYSNGSQICVSRSHNHTKYGKHALR